MKRVVLMISAAAALTLTGTGALASGDEREHHGMHDNNHGSMAVTPSAETLAMGKAVYEKTCAVCHNTGVAGAPKLGDKASWGPHLAEGIDHLLEVAIRGEGAMPPRGGNPALSNEELRAAVSYMLEEVR